MESYGTMIGEMARRGLFIDPTKLIEDRQGPGNSDPRIHRRRQRSSQTLPVDQDGGSDSGQYCSLRSPHPHFPRCRTYLTNHWDRRL